MKYTPITQILLSHDCIFLIPDMLLSPASPFAFAAAACIGRDSFPERRVFYQCLHLTGRIGPKRSGAQMFETVQQHE